MRTLIAGTDIGLVRSVNQDRFCVNIISDTLAYAVLCDGMGGENGGHVASELACGYADETLGRDLVDGMNESSIRGVLMSVFAGANAVVREAARKDEALSGMGTTMIAAVISGDSLYAACVGDSRIYRASANQVEQLTRDHTVVQMLLDIGEITPQDAALHPQRHYITRAVGAADSIDADFLVQKLSQNDRILLCSDGLYNYLESGDMYPLLDQCLKGDNVTPLIDLAKSSGGGDNITAIVMA